MWEERALHPFYEVFEHLFERLLISISEADTRQREEGVAAAGAEPREAGEHTCAVLLLNNKLFRRVLEAMHEAVAWDTLFYLALKLMLESGRCLLFKACRDHHALSRTHRHLKEPRDVEVFHRVISALKLPDIEDIFIPVRAVRVFRRLGHLEA